MHRRGFKRAVAVVALCLAAVFLAAGFFTHACTKQPEDELTVRFLNVGQGDCALVSCEGHHVLIDGGPSDHAQTVYAVLEDLGIDYLDVVLITHTDSDHCGGIPAALQYAEAGTCYCSTDSADTATWNKVLDALSKQDISIEVPQDGYTFDLGEASITILGSAENFSSDNDGSLVCRIDFGRTSFLFTGDIEESREHSLLEENADLRASVLKVSHHGSNHSTSAEFLEAVQPEYAVVSVGENDYGHPGTWTLERLSSSNAQVYRTDRDGHVVFTSDGNSLEVNTVKGRLAD